MRRQSIQAGIVLLMLILPLQALAERHALVIGNSQYQYSPLKNPRNDARDMAAVLKDLGYRIAGGDAQLDLDAESFDRVFHDFRTSLSNGDTVVFYFAGHGAVDNRESYLIPVNSRITEAFQLARRSISLSEVIDGLQRDNPDGLNALFIDACRDQPFGRSFRTTSRGLVRPSRVPLGTFVGMAASEGQVAADGKGRNGLYTGQLLAQLRDNPAQEIEDLHKAVARQVYHTSRKRGVTQRPTYRTDLIERWCLVDCANAIAQSSPTPTPTPTPTPVQAPKPQVVEKTRLTVRTEPKNARVRVMNIAPKYRDGIEVKRGERYDILVTASGYQPYRGWHTADKSSQVIDIALKVNPKPAKRKRQWFEPEMVDIPGGSFRMGCLNDDGDCEDNEKPVRSVQVKPFRLGRTEVTVSQFRAFVRSTGYTTDAERDVGESGCGTFEDGEWKFRDGRDWRRPGYTQADESPVVCVSWNDAQAYIEWLNGETGRSYRLPSEAEWEYSARGGTQTKYWFGNDPADLCIYGNVADQTRSPTGRGWKEAAACSDGYFFPAPVGSFKRTWRGLKDMHGNVWEWLQDRWHDDYKGAPTDGRAWQSGSDPRRVLRGGSWDFKPESLRAADRLRNYPASRYDDAGFRLAEDASR